MRRYYVVLFLGLTFSAYAVDCDENNIHVGPFPKNCANIFINTNYSPPYGTPTIILLLEPGGIVDIKANINLDGEAGRNVLYSGLGDATIGGQGGPGAGAGGGIDMFEDPEDGQDGAIANGKAAFRNTTCGNGGGGGALNGTGKDGTPCSTSTDPLAVGAGGTSAIVAGEFAFDLSLFRGGYGGGAGGISASANIGIGGGGGGGLHIDAGNSDIIIRSGVTISAKGGDGGPATLDGGGGGGGSGGAIWFKTTGRIRNQGTINVSGGSGGRNTSNQAGGHGGAGSTGIYLLRDETGVTQGGGIFKGSDQNNFKSSISCATISEDEQKPMFFQLLSGFILAAALSLGIKTLYRFLNLASKKIALLH
jgi:hypothetical protein